jgi:hypothetical protein
VRRLALAATLLLAAPAARAESPRFGSFELRVGWYRPSIDAEFAGATPYADAFGTGRSISVGALFGKSVWITKVGTLDLGIGAGYWEKYGSGISPSGGRGDSTSLKMVPLQLAATYRIDWLADAQGVPFLPYVRVAGLDHIWWANDGAGNTVKSGQTFGYAFSGGVGFLLDFIDPGLAREMDLDVGINHTMVFADVTKSYVKGFGSSKSWDLSSDGAIWTVGLSFIF